MNFDFLLDMVFPRRCPVCDDVLPFGGELICSGCRERLQYVEEPRCRKCGKALYDETGEYCADCRETAHFFNRAVSAFVYNDAARDAVFRFKYRGRQEYARFFAESIWQRLKDDIGSFNAPALIPVPIHKERLKKRGYNQAALLAKELSKLSGYPVYDKIIRRVRNTAPQKNLSRAERMKNMKRAFTISGNVVELTGAVIVDDIYTTGSTVDEMSKVLKSAGMRDIYVVTVCSGTPL